MTSRRRALLPLLLVCVIAAGLFTLPPVAQAQEETVAEATSDHYQAMLAAGDAAGLWSHMTSEMRQALQSEASFAAFIEGVHAQFGSETALERKTVVQHHPFEITIRVARHELAPLPVMTQWTRDEAGRIAGFFIQVLPQPAGSSFADKPYQGALRLPFQGAWTVYWGGESADLNYHVIDRAQRFATDFLMTQDGRSFRTDGKTPQDYLCWDEPILAPADGKVAAIVNDLPDQDIGSRDPANPAGNHVVLELGESAFAFLAHLRKGSITVEKGEAIEAGDEIGRCGNSGNSTEPHLHFHMQSTADLATGQGVPAQFSGYRVEGKPVARGIPGRGETVETSD